MIAAAETRRNAAVRELERYRENAARWRHPAEEVIDAEFRDAGADRRTLR
jgi:hypothetical protein